MLLVRDLCGPAEVPAKSNAVFRVTRYNLSDPPQEERDKVSWEIRSGERPLASFHAVGDSLALAIPEDWEGQTILVTAFRAAPSPVASVTTKVIGAKATPAAVSHVDSLRRSDWAARPELPRLGLLVDRVKRTEVFIHHTAAIDHDTGRNKWESLKEVCEQMRKLQTLGERELGSDIPYNMVAFCMTNGDLILGEGRGLHRSGAHTRGHNTSALGIAFHGDFDNSSPPAHFDAQLLALGGWLRDLRVNDGFSKLGASRPFGREVFAHRDVKAITCPGQHLFAKLNLIRFL